MIIPISEQDDKSIIRQMYKTTSIVIKGELIKINAQISDC